MKFKIPYIYYDSYTVGRTAVLEIDFMLGKLKLELPCISRDAAEEIVSQMLRNQDNLNEKYLRQFIVYLIRRLSKER